jgi:twitching motility protein PilI
MEANHLETAKQQSTDWPSPTEALTQFLPLESEVTTTNLATHTEAIFGFRVGSLGFLVTSSTYCEVIEQLQVNPLPNVETWFSGLINLRGDLVPVIDLQLLLEESVTEHKKRQLFAIGQGDKAMAFWIDGLPEIQSSFSQPLKQLPPLPTILQRCVSAGYFYNDQLWFSVQFDDLFKTLGRHYTADEVVS